MSLTLSWRWVDILMWTPLPQGCLYLGPSQFSLKKSLAKSLVVTSYRYLAWLQRMQRILNVENSKFRNCPVLGKIVIYYQLPILSRRELGRDSLDLSHPFLDTSLCFELHIRQSKVNLFLLLYCNLSIITTGCILLIDFF